jgi:hypothetical protein
MAGLAFLPWEKLFGPLVHSLDVSIRRRLYLARRGRSLALSAGWSQAEGTVHSVNWDSSYPREEIVYSYSTERGYYSGYFWRWFDSSDAREVRVGDRIALRYDPAEHDKSVFLTFSLILPVDR